jgi:hypothetical protein
MGGGEWSTPRHGRFRSGLEPNQTSCNGDAARRTLVAKWITTPVVHLNGLQDPEPNVLLVALFPRRLFGTRRTSWPTYISLPSLISKSRCQHSTFNQNRLLPNPSEITIHKRVTVTFDTAKPLHIKTFPLRNLRIIIIIIDLCIDIVPIIIISLLLCFFLLLSMLHCT